MLKVEKIIKEAIERDASDIHLLYGLKPILRIKRDLVEINEMEALNETDLCEVYEYIVKGNVDKDTVYKKDRKLDASLVYDGMRLRVNVSYADEKQTFTMRIIKNTLPKFDDLNLPEVIRTSAYLPQGLMLITGKTNSGKSTTLSALVDDINEKQNKKILSLESPIEYKHTSKKSIIVQKEIGPGKDCLTYDDGVINALREDCDILIIRRNS